MRDDIECDVIYQWSRGLKTNWWEIMIQFKNDWWNDEFKRRLKKVYLLEFSILISDLGKEIRFKYLDVYLLELNLLFPNF